MQRSGSTLQFQIAAHLVEEAGLGRRIEWAAREPMKKYQHDPALIVAKTHRFSAEKGRELKNGNAFGIYIHRDLRDVMVSKMRKDDRSFAETYCSYFLEFLLQEDRFWTRQPNLMFSRYEEVLADLPAEVVRIANFLGIEVSLEKASVIADEFSIQKQKQRLAAAKSETMVRDPYFQNALYDPATNLHANHFGGGEIEGWRKKLSKWQIALIEHTAGEWLEARGYPLAFSRPVRWFWLTFSIPLRLRRRWMTRGRRD